MLKLTIGIRHFSLIVDPLFIVSITPYDCLLRFRDRELYWEYGFGWKNESVKGSRFIDILA